METLITTIVFVTLLAVALYTIMSFIHERNKNKREWDAYWSNQGTFGHCGQNIKCRCKIGGRPAGPIDTSYFFSKEQTDEMDKLLKRYRNNAESTERRRR